MAGKKKGLLTVSKEWAKHLRPYGRRLFWSSERKAAQHHMESEIDAELSSRTESKVLEQSESGVTPDRSLKKTGVHQRRPRR